MPRLQPLTEEEKRQTLEREVYVATAMYADCWVAQDDIRRTVLDKSHSDDVLYAPGSRYGEVLTEENFPLSKLETALKQVEGKGWIEPSRVLVDRKFRKMYRLTEEGKKVWERDGKRLLV